MTFLFVLYSKTLWHSLIWILFIILFIKPFLSETFTIKKWVKKQTHPFFNLKSQSRKLGGWSFREVLKGLRESVFLQFLLLLLVMRRKRWWVQRNRGGRLLEVVIKRCERRGAVGVRGGRGDVRGVEGSHRLMTLFRAKTFSVSRLNQLHQKNWTQKVQLVNLSDWLQTKSSSGLVQLLSWFKVFLLGYKDPKP